MIIIGKGQIGSELVKVFPNAICLTHNILDIEYLENLKHHFEKYKPKVVISTAAFHNVDKCEVEKEKAILTNVLGTLNLSLACLQYNCKLVWFSTDYVFNKVDMLGVSKIDEKANKNPLNFYGKTKSIGEDIISSILDNYIIIRTSSVYGEKGASGKGGNFVETIVKKIKESTCTSIPVVTDQIMCPTYAKELAEQVKIMIENNLNGIYHVCNECEGISWYTFASEILNILNLNANLTMWNSNNAIRPSYSALSCEKLKEKNLYIMSNWKVALRKYLTEKNYLR